VRGELGECTVRGSCEDCFFPTGRPVKGGGLLQGPTATRREYGYGRRAETAGYVSLQERKRLEKRQSRIIHQKMFSPQRVKKPALRDATSGLLDCGRSVVIRVWASRTGDQQREFFESLPVKKRLRQRGGSWKSNGEEQGQQAYGDPSFRHSEKHPVRMKKTIRVTGQKAGRPGRCSKGKGNLLLLPQ